MLNSKKAKIWTSVFLGITALAIGLELVAAWDSSDDTHPWTNLIVNYVPMELFVFLWGGLAIWGGIHFGVRYARKRKGKK